MFCSMSANKFPNLCKKSEIYSSLLRKCLRGNDRCYANVLMNFAIVHRIEFTTGGHT